MTENPQYEANTSNPVEPAKSARPRNNPAVDKTFLPSGMLVRGWRSTRAMAAVSPFVMSFVRNECSECRAWRRRGARYYERPRRAFRSSLGRRTLVTPVRFLSKPMPEAIVGKRVTKSGLARLQRVEGVSTPHERNEHVEHSSRSSRLGHPRRRRRQRARRRTAGLGPRRGRVAAAARAHTRSRWFHTRLQGPDRMQAS